MNTHTSGWTVDLAGAFQLGCHDEIFGSVWFTGSSYKINCVYEVCQLKCAEDHLGQV